MRNGFEFKGKHSNDFGITARTKSRPSRPEAKSVTYDAALVDGSYELSDANEYGRMFYNDRIFEMDLQIAADNLAGLEKKVSKISAWIMGKGDLILDSIPLVKWRARVMNNITFVPKHNGKKAILSVSFRTKPFSTCIFDTIDGPCLDDELELDSNMPIGIDEYFTWNFSGKNGLIEFNNIGTWYVRPILEITSQTAQTSIKLTTDNASFTVSGNNITVVTIDCEKQTVFDQNGKNITGQTKGNFFEFGTGKTTMNIDTSVSANITIVVKYEPEFVYDMDMEDIDWE